MVLPTDTKFDEIQLQFRKKQFQLDFSISSQHYYSMSKIRLY